MDPTVAHVLAEAIGPGLAILMIGAIPISLVFITKHFKLKTREMELERELHGKETESRLRTLEARQAAFESALTAIATGISAGQFRNEAPTRAALMEPPPAEEGPLAPAPIRVVRE